MKKILILGNSGSGKTTLAREMGEILNIPVIHLDKFFWRPYWEPIPRCEWEKIVKDLLNRDTWIMDGNYHNTLEVRLPFADTVIYLQISTWKSLKRVFGRFFGNIGKCRPDVGVNCREKIDWDFIKWIWNFNRKIKPKILESISKRQNLKVYIIKSKWDRIDFIKRIRNESSYK